MDSEIVRQIGRRVKAFFNALKTGWLPAAYKMHHLDRGILLDRGSRPVRPPHDGSIQFDCNAVPLNLNQLQESRYRRGGWDAPKLAVQPDLYS